MSVGKRSPSLNPLNLTVRDNVPPGCEVSLAGIRHELNFAEMFREELMRQGIGIVRQEGRRGRKKLD